MDLEEVTPHCDICGGPEDQDPTNGREYNWNGETGNHLSCEQGRALVVQEIVEHSEASYDAAKSALVTRLEDFMLYIDTLEQEGADIYIEAIGPEASRKRFVLEYVNQAIEHEDEDPIEAIMYALAAKQLADEGRDGDLEITLEEEEAYIADQDAMMRGE